MSKYTNKWIDDSTGKIIVSETRPQGKDVFPMYAESRVDYCKHTYVPYDGNSEWVKAANRAMFNASRP